MSFAADNKVIGLIEPCYYGLGFLNALAAYEFPVVAIVSDRSAPQKYSYVGKVSDLIVVEDIYDPDMVLKRIAESDYHDRFAAILPATDYLTDVAAEVAERLSLRAVSLPAAQRGRNKDLARLAYCDAQVGSPDFRIIRKRSENETLLDAREAARQLRYPVVLKPTNCACSQMVKRVNHETELDTEVRHHLRFKTSMLGLAVAPTILLEEYIEGPEFSVELFLNDGTVAFAAVTEKETTEPPYFVEIAHVTPAPIPDSWTASLVECATRATLALGFTYGPAHVELRMDGGKPGAVRPIIMEVNARPGGDRIATDLLRHAYGADLFDATLCYYLDRPIDIQKRTLGACAIRYLVPQRAGKIQAIRGLEDARRVPGVVECQVSGNEGCDVRLPQDSNDRLGYIITFADDPITARNLAQQVIRGLKVEYSEALAD
ncbi:MAG: ATP-grasp domain-containing protein [Gemmataceae bacterium]